MSYNSASGPCRAITARLASGGRPGEFGRCCCRVRPRSYICLHNFGLSSEKIAILCVYAAAYVMRTEHKLQRRDFTIKRVYKIIKRNTKSSFVRRVHETFVPPAVCRTKWQGRLEALGF